MVRAPAECASRIAECVDAGATTITLRLTGYHQKHQFRRVTEDVLPRLFRYGVLLITYEMERFANAEIGTGFTPGREAVRDRSTSKRFLAPLAVRTSQSRLLASAKTRVR